ncbi:unnamed protein product (mitochondrion) [Plasmodiophora brassicae]|uniref:Pseudouridine synthase I TruA alpha/beta domain-containing protein n=1 Tax=Plasmodiophora brassicae TaxID=37360 RepID=A0A3P3YGR2_PLABS|nr:unnamed protein product [Plasmodiophora brassicae]
MADAAETPQAKQPKKKAAVIFGYLGTNYSGLQINPGVSTVEQALELALYKAGAISDANHEGGFSKIQWTRSSRTDKGVHAGANVVALKCMIGDPDLLAKVRSHLPQDIALHGIIRATRSFNAKNATSSREYEYIMPAWMFSRQHEEFVKSVLSDGADEAMVSGLVQPVTLADDDLAAINSITNAFRGTLNYHNFSSGTDSFDPSSNRYITKFHASLLQLPEGQFVRFEIHGQSFLFNMIRLMVGAVLGVHHGVINSDLLHKKDLFDSRKKFHLPLAPALGLFLQKPLFSGYLKKVPEMELTELKDDIAAFIQDRIYSEIARLDSARNEFARWLCLLYRGHSHTGSWNTFTELTPGAATQPPKKKRKKPAPPGVEDWLKQKPAPSECQTEPAAAD